VFGLRAVAAARKPVLEMKEDFNEKPKGHKKYD
jgi:hypothetical protein